MKKHICQWEKQKGQKSKSNPHSQKGQAVVLDGSSSSSGEEPLTQAASVGVSMSPAPGAHHGEGHTHVEAGWGWQMPCHSQSSLVSPTPGPFARDSTLVAALW